MFGGRLGWTEILLILVVVMLIFGPAKLPQLGKSIGEGMREFKKSVKGVNDEAGDEKDESKKA
ncbi:MAG TPA: twin-arginine translocase TatA/TatE family subunit [Symbiobacteriaceae bacterium]|jgi:sec-independent protein translocase protein TatA|nr:twin-arginine translocase TatA/TatE family subunit [Symbiobacteriaceae bacterium]